jgi:hypothetical protein
MRHSSEKTLAPDHDPARALLPRAVRKIMSKSRRQKS